MNLARLVDLLNALVNNLGGQIIDILRGMVRRRWTTGLLAALAAHTSQTPCCLTFNVFLHRVRAHHAPPPYSSTQINQFSSSAANIENAVVAQIQESRTVLYEPTAAIDRARYIFLICLYSVCLLELVLLLLSMFFRCPALFTFTLFLLAVLVRRHQDTWGLLLGVGGDPPQHLGPPQGVMRTPPFHHHLQVAFYFLIAFALAWGLSIGNDTCYGTETIALSFVRNKSPRIANLIAYYFFDQPSSFERVLADNGIIDIQDLDEAVRAFLIIMGGARAQG